MADLSQLPPTATAKAEYTKPPAADDPYSYTTGFGNRFISEALPGVISWSQNTPQRVKYGLYSEQLNGSAVNSKRTDVRHVWLYRIRPSVAHGPVRLDPSINEHVRGSVYTRYMRLKLTSFSIQPRLSPLSSPPTPKLSHVPLSKPGILSLFLMRPAAPSQSILSKAFAPSAAKETPVLRKASLSTHTRQMPTWPDKRFATTTERCSFFLSKVAWMYTLS